MILTKKELLVFLATCVSSFSLCIVLNDSRPKKGLKFGSIHEAGKFMFLLTEYTTFEDNASG